MKKIAVLTSGGDASGMNSCIKILFDLCKKQNYELYGIKYGYQGLINNDFTLLKEGDVQYIFNQGGSVLKSSRCADFLLEEKKQVAKQNLIDRQIDYLVIIGGNGSLKGAFDFSKYFQNILFIPATIDNDVGYTDQTLGFDTAVNNATVDIEKIHDSLQTFDRGLIVETMGRHCNDIAVYCAISTNADMVITKTQSFDEILNLVQELVESGNTSPLIVIKESILNIDNLAKFLEQKLNKTFKTTVLGYIQRGGSPTVGDRILASELSQKVIDCINNNQIKIAVGKKKEQVIVETLQNAASQGRNSDNNLLNVFTKIKC